MSDWRTPTEREELVERLLATEARAANAERTLKDLAEQEGDRSLAHLVAVYQNRVAVLEKNQTKLLAERGSRAA